MQKNVEKRDNQTIYNIRFRNLADLYKYLKDNPEINHKVFTSPYSMSDKSDFYGKDLETSIEYCKSGYVDAEFNNFLRKNNQLVKTVDNYLGRGRIKNSMYVGMPIASLVASGVPDCFEVYDEEEEIVVRNIYFNLAYPSYTSEEKIINRGLATLYLIQALESKGEIVNFRVFELSKCGSEIANIEVNLKKPGDKLDIGKCYFPIKAKEFLRRVLFRVLESSQVKERDWGDTYGTPLTEEEIREFFKVKPSDLVISSPDEMGIEGDDIYEDTLNLITSLGIEKEFNVPKIKELKLNKNRK